ncbi:YndM family protein [Planococcus maritimus]|nr:YndM family protein [Planococcus sp. SK3692]MDE4085539.1 YndM family protein [Planococcus maritimus]
MKHIEAILMKFAMSFAVVFLILGLIYGVSVFDIFVISLVITVIGYVGDMLLFPRTSNKIATAGDLVLAFLIVWLLGEFLIGNTDFSILAATIYTAILIAAGEWFYHIYLKKRLWEQKETSHTLKQEPNKK